MPAIKLYIHLIFLFLLPCRQLFVFFFSIGITITNSDYGAKVPIVAISCSMLKKDRYLLLADLRRSIQFLARERDNEEKDQIAQKKKE